MAYTPTPLEMMCSALGAHGYESLFRLSLCEVGVDAVEDAGRVLGKIFAMRSVQFCHIGEHLSHLSILTFGLTKYVVVGVFDEQLQQLAT